MTETEAYRFLLVDDDEDDFVLMRSYVQQMRYAHQLDWVGTYDEALKWMIQGGHDLYLVDYHLGAKNGVELLQAARERGCRGPVMILTGQDQTGFDGDALDAGAADYLEKAHITPNLLERAARYAIHQQQDHNTLEDLYKKVSRLEKLKTDMIRLAAHDLRTPLTTINGYVDMLKQDLQAQVDPPPIAYLDEIKGAVQDMQKLVRDILSLQRIEAISGGYTTPVDLKALVKMVFNQYKVKSSQRFMLTTPIAPVQVYGAEQELREVLDNLLSNAVKYTPPEGHIVVQLAVDAAYALFAVEDDGYGIPEDKQAQLFDPFYRAKTRETRKIDGTGLGLHLVKSIIERHNGHVHFKSTYGKGSTFGFMLPIMSEKND